MLRTVSGGGSAGGVRRSFPRRQSKIKMRRGSHLLELRYELPGLGRNPVGTGFSGDVRMRPVEGADLCGIALLAPCEIHAQVVA